jgi:ParB-like chromosome segregation protein Spo0J
VHELDGQVVAEGGGYRLAVPFDELRYRDRPLTRTRRTDHELGDLFNPLTGARFAGNIRTDKSAMSRDTMAELRESMREFGWVKQFPALVDERGVVLVGHRRIAVAKELGIDPVTETLNLGRGDAADAERLKIALASNLGFKPMSPTDRKNVGEALYREGWSMQRIGEALRVSAATVSRDLAGISHDEKVKRGGRTGRPRTKPKPKSPEVEQRITERVAEGASIKELNREFPGMDGRDAKQRAIGRLEAQPAVPAAHEHTPAWMCSQCHAVVQESP